MKRILHILAVALVTGSMHLNAELADPAAAMAALAELPEAEQYRQLNLLMMVSDGVEPSFLDYLESHFSATTGTAGLSEKAPLLVVEDFQTPLNRIADPTALMGKAVQLFRFAHDQHSNILQSLDRIARGDSDAVLEVDLMPLAEDAIIIRSAFSGSLEQQLTGSASDAHGYLDTYRSRTVYLRNMMEFWDFDRELATITDEAMTETGGKMDAYQRLLEDKPDLDGFNKHLQAVEMIYRQAREGKMKPAEVPYDELMEAESQVN